MSGSGTGDRLVTLSISWDHSGAPSGPYQFRKDPRIRDQTVGFCARMVGWNGVGRTEVPLPQGYGVHFTVWRVG